MELFHLTENLKESKPARFWQPLAPTDVAEILASVDAKDDKKIKGICTRSCTEIL